jgi:hypothetical protein
VLDAVLRCPLTLQHKIDFFDTEEFVETRELVQHLACDHRSLRPPDSLREQKQSDRSLNDSKMFADDLSILIRKQRHVVQNPERRNGSEIEEIVECFSRVIVSGRRRFALDGRARREERAGVASVLRTDPFGDWLCALESTARIKRRALRA